MNKREVLQVAAVGKKEIIILTILTLGIYLPIYLDHARRQLNIIAGQEVIKPLYVQAAAVTLGAYYFMSRLISVAAMLAAMFGAEDMTFVAFLAVDFLANLLCMTLFAGLIIFLSFKFRKILEDYARTAGLELQMNPLFTAFFNLFYINYSVHKLIAQAAPATVATELACDNRI